MKRQLRCSLSSLPENLGVLQCALLPRFEEIYYGMQSWAIANQSTSQNTLIKVSCYERLKY